MLTQGWGDFIAWLEGHQASAEVFVAIAALVVTAGLVGVTFAYARAARQQADASTKMAQEMREARHGGVLPVVDFILKPLNGSEQLSRVFQIKAGRFPETQWASLKNIGLGPALDVRFRTKLDDAGPNWRSVGHLGLGEVAERKYGPPGGRWPLYLEPISDLVKRLGVEYCDAYGREYESWRDITFDPAGGDWKIGPLHTRS